MKRIRFQDAALSFISGTDVRPIFRNCSFEISDRLNFVYGPSGSGKSTLLRLLDLELGLTAGHLWFDEVDTSHLLADEVKLFRECIFLVNGSFFDGYSLLDNLALLLKRPGFSYEETRSALLADAEFDDIGLKQKLRRLSSGQKNKVVLLAAQKKKADLILLDEPSSNLHSDDLPDLISALVALARKAIVVVATNDERLKGIDGAIYHTLSGEKVNRA